MNQTKKLKISFSTRNCCIINIPSDIKKEEICDFIVDKITSEELNKYVERWIDFEIEDLTLE